MINRIIVLFDDTLSITRTIHELTNTIPLYVMDISGKIEWKKTPQKIGILNDIINAYWQGRDLNEVNDRINFIKDEEYNEDDLDDVKDVVETYICLLYTSPSPRDPKTSRMPSSA